MVSASSPATARLRKILEFLAHVYHIYAEYARPEKKDAAAFETADEKRRKDGAQAKLSEAVVAKVRDEHRGCHERYVTVPRPSLM